MITQIQPSMRQSSLLIRKAVLPQWKNCVYCNARVSNQTTFDHLLPKSIQEKLLRLLPNGINSIVNLVPACKKCNNKRGNMLLSKWLLEVKPESVVSLKNFFKTLENIQINHIDYVKGIKKTILKILEIEKESPEAKGLNIDKLIEDLGIR